MEDAWDIKAGDQLMCMSNEGLQSIGDIVTIWGITNKSINLNGGDTNWRDRNNFRWHCYKFHNRPNEVSEEIKEFTKHTKWVCKNNEKILQKRKLELNQLKTVKE